MSVINMLISDNLIVIIFYEKLHIKRIFFHTHCKDNYLCKKIKMMIFISCIFQLGPYIVIYQMFILMLSCFFSPM